MTNDDQKRIEQRARDVLDQNSQDLPEEITSALSAARMRAMEAARAQDGSEKPSAKIYSFTQTRVVWSGAIAASVTALALTLALQQPGADLPTESADYLLSLAELESLDDTEWALVQDLEFALWLSELGELDELGGGAFEPQG